MNAALAFILGAAGPEFAWTIRDLLAEHGIALNDITTAVMGITLV